MSHIIKYDLCISRDYGPVYFLDGVRVPAPTPPIRVEVSVEFDYEASASQFEMRVKELLEDL